MARRTLKPETVQKRRDFVYRMLEARLLGYNVRHADEFVRALRNLDASPQRETIVLLMQAVAKML